MTTGRNRPINRLRRDRTLAAKTRLLEVPEAAEDPAEETAFPDERSSSSSPCCHPALALEGARAVRPPFVGPFLVWVHPGEASPPGARSAADGQVLIRSGQIRAVGFVYVGLA